MHTLNNKQHQHKHRPHSLVSVLAACCLLAACAFFATPSYADASNRQDAINQALAKSSGDAKVLGVKQINNDGQLVFAVKLISNGRVKIIHIPKSRSE